MLKSLLNKKSNSQAKKLLGISICLMMLSITSIDAQTDVDLSPIMKQMRFEYNRAMKAESGALMSDHIKAFKQQLNKAQNYPFNKQRIDKATEGLSKVAAIIDSIQLPIDDNAVEATKKKLSQIDQIKEQYHDKKVSLWDRFYEQIFGPDDNNEKLILIDD